MYLKRQDMYSHEKSEVEATQAGHPWHFSRFINDDFLSVISLLHVLTGCLKA